MRVYEPNYFGLQDVAIVFRGDKCEDEMRGGWCQTVSLFYMEEMLLNQGESISDRLMIGFKTLLERVEHSEPGTVRLEDLLTSLDFERRFVELFGRGNQFCALTNFLRALAKRYVDLQTKLFTEFVAKLVDGGHDETLAGGGTTGMSRSRMVV